MATKKTRINITYEKETINLLTELAKKQDRSTAGFAKELMLEGIRKEGRCSTLSSCTNSRHSNSTKNSP